jgi:hypothetical protein
MDNFDEQIDSPIKIERRILISLIVCSDGYRAGIFNDTKNVPNLLLDDQIERILKVIEEDRGEEIKKDLDLERMTEMRDPEQDGRL